MRVFKTKMGLSKHAQRLQHGVVFQRKIHSLYSTLSHYVHLLKTYKTQVLMTHQLTLRGDMEFSIKILLPSKIYLPLNSSAQPSPAQPCPRESTTMSLRSLNQMNVEP